MKKILMLLVVTAITVVALGQKPTRHPGPHRGPETKSAVKVRVGATLYAPLTKNVAWDSKSWGEKVEIDLFNSKTTSAHASLSYMQNKAGFAQMPVMFGVRRNLYKNVHIGADAGVSFFKDAKSQSTYNLAIGARFKRWTIEQSVLRTIKDGKHSSITGASLLYNL